MQLFISILVGIAIMVLVIYVVLTRSKKMHLPAPAISDSSKELLNEYVEFYNKLNTEQQREFERRVQSFLARVRITGIKTTVEELDRVLIAASAIIPIFGFPEWEYINLNEILLYPDSFGDEFEQEG